MEVGRERILKLAIDKLILIIICLICNFESKSLTSIVIASLCIVSVVSYSTIWNQKKRTLYLIGAYLVLAIFFPIFSIYIPVLLYLILQEKSYYMNVFAFITSISYFMSAGYYKGAILISLILVAVILALRTQSILKLEDGWKQLRDQSTEITMLLKNQNRTLQEKQDYEIYTATLRERNRIAREIHDNVGHMLSRSILQVGALLAVTKEGAVTKNLENLKDTLNLAMNNIRESVHDLHDESISLSHSVEELLSYYKQYEVIYSYEIEEEVPHSIKYCFIALVKEAMTNIVKHSNATKVIVYLYANNTSYKLKIKDNGTRFEESVEYKGIGIENMRDRVQSLSGMFTATYSEGFLVIASIPKELNKKRRDVL